MFWQLNTKKIVVSQRKVCGRIRTSQYMFLSQSTELKACCIAGEEGSELYTSSPCLGLLMCFFEQENIAGQTSFF